jgi:hypothetical protein
VSVHREDPPSWWQRERQRLAALLDDRALWVGVACFTAAAAAGYCLGYRDGAEAR